MLNIKEPGSNGRVSSETKLNSSNAQSGREKMQCTGKGKDHPAYGNIGYWKINQKNNIQDTEVMVIKIQITEEVGKNTQCLVKEQGEIVHLLRK
jgi:hypothetical protein